MKMIIFSILFEMNHQTLIRFPEPKTAYLVTLSFFSRFSFLSNLYLML